MAADDSLGRIENRRAILELSGVDAACPVRLLGFGATQ